MAIRYADWTNGQDFSIKRDRTTAITAWSAATTYALDALVHNNAAHPNRKCYKSLQAGNLNHALTDGAWWVLVADGSAALPFQSITDATQGLTGGDECRVAESPADTPLSGTLTFTEGSTTLTGSGTAFTTELVIGDFVLGGDGVEYEIITISSNTAAVLYKKYPESTQSGIACVKVGMTETGAAYSSNTQVQAINSSGTLALGNIIISGGWNLSTELQTGKTRFKQKHGTFATRNGYGLYVIKMFLTIKDVGFFRYYNGMYTITEYNYIHNNIVCSSNGNYGIEMTSSSYFGEWNNCNFYSNHVGGISFTGSKENTINDCKFHSNTSYGVSFSSGTSAIFNGCDFKYNDVGLSLITNDVMANNCNFIKNISYGIAIASKSNHNIISSSYFDTTGFASNDAIRNVLNNPIFVSGAIIKNNAPIMNENQLISVQCFNNTKGDNRNYFYGGMTKSNTANAITGKCLEYNPTSASVYMSHSFFFKATDATACQLSAQVMKNAAFNGDVQGAVYFMGLPVIDWVDITPYATDAYEAMAFQILAGMVTDDSVLELRIKVRGTAGAVYVDDLGQI